VIRTPLATLLLGSALVAPSVSSAEEGGRLVGIACPEWAPERWLQGGPLRLADLRGKVVLLRFFTSTDCPYCGATAPALNELDREFREKGLVVVGMYTPKPDPRAVTDDEVRHAVEAYGFRFPVAVDGAWGTLNRLWLDRVPAASFTSASLLIDRRGIVRHVQRGGAYAPDAEDASARADYRAMRDAIERWTAAR
jgi:peroxiredoxin